MECVRRAHVRPALDEECLRCCRRVLVSASPAVLVGEPYSGVHHESIKDRDSFRLDRASYEVNESWKQAFPEVDNTSGEKTRALRPFAIWFGRRTVRGGSPNHLRNLHCANSDVSTQIRKRREKYVPCEKDAGSSKQVREIQHWFLHRSLP